VRRSPITSWTLKAAIWANVAENWKFSEKILSKRLIANFKEISVHCLRDGTSRVGERKDMVTVVSF